MNAKLQTIFDGQVRILSNSINAVHAIITDQHYKGIEELLSNIINDLIKDNSVEGVYYW